MGCGSSVAQEPATKTSQDVAKNSPKPPLMRADKFLSREEARERRQQAMKEKQLQSQNNARAISAQALIDQERLSTSTKRSLRSYASSSTTTPLKAADNSKLFTDVQSPASASKEMTLTTHPKDALESSPSSQKTAEEDRVLPVVIVEENTISSEKAEQTVFQQSGLAKGDTETLEPSSNQVGGKIECMKDGGDIVTTLPEKIVEDNSVIKENHETRKDENAKNDLNEENDHLSEEISEETQNGPAVFTEDTKEGPIDGEQEKSASGAEEILDKSNHKDKSSVRFSDTVTILENSVGQGQRSSPVDGENTPSVQSGVTGSEGASDEDEGALDHHIGNDTEVVKTANRVGEDNLNDTWEGSDEGVADLGEIGEENELEVFPAVS